MFVGFGAALGGNIHNAYNLYFFPTQGFGYLLLALAAVLLEELLIGGVLEQL